MTPVTLDDILRSREAFAARQRALLERVGLPVISFRLNVAGPVKTTPLLRRGFLLGKRMVDEQLARHGVAVVAGEGLWARTGDEWLGAVAGDAREVKRLMIEVEEDGLFGRVLDLDVTDSRGKRVDRAAVGAVERGCLICGERGKVCARSRAHAAEVLFAETERRVRERLNARLADRVAAMAQRALLYELAVTPKPGLVDRRNGGAHHDMGFFTFLDSAAVLVPFFRDCVLIGLEQEEGLLPALQYCGMRAETAMMEATQGVNTHKGAIFCLGLICGVLGMRARRGVAWDLAALCGDCSRLIGGGAMATGARAEAASGFDSVIRYGLPVLHGALQRGWSLEEAGVMALLALMAEVEDTNLIRRGGPEGRRAAAKTARSLLATAEPPFEAIQAWDEDLIRANLSPGGCADLLAVTYLLHFLDNGGMDIQEY